MFSLKAFLPYTVSGCKSDELKLLEWWLRLLRQEKETLCFRNVAFPTINGLKETLFSESNKTFTMKLLFHLLDNIGAFV